MERIIVAIGVMIIVIGLAGTVDLGGWLVLQLLNYIRGNCKWGTINIFG